MHMKPLWFVDLLLEPFPISSSTHAKLLENLPIPFLWKLFFAKTAFLHFCIATCGLIIFTARFIMDTIPLFFYYPINSFLCISALLLPLPCLYIALKQVHASEKFLGIGFLITALLLASLIFAPKGTSIEQSLLVFPHKAFLIGIAQAISLFPGCSRLGFTFVVARWCGVQAEDALYLSFTMILPFFALQGATDLFNSWNILKNFNGTTWVGAFFITALFYNCLCLTLVLAITNKLFLFSLYLLILSGAMGIKYIVTN